MENDSNGDDRLVVVHQYLHGYEAHLAKGRLEAEGITAEVIDEDVAGINWQLWNAGGGVKLLVREADAGRAHAILDRDEPGDDGAAPRETDS